MEPRAMPTVRSSQRHTSAWVDVVERVYGRYSLGAERVRFHIRKNRHVRVPHNITGVGIVVDWPERRDRIVQPEAVRVLVVYEAGPGVAHQPCEINVALGLVSERVRRSLVAVPARVVEHEGDLVVVGRTSRNGFAVDPRVETIAVRGCATSCPGLALETAVGDEDGVSGEGRGTAEPAA